VLSKAGDQVPVIELIEVVGNADKLPPEHIGETVVNVGVVPEITFTVTVSVLSTLQEFVTFNIIVIDPVADGLIV
jgi:hypothetical protein